MAKEKLLNTDHRSIAIKIVKFSIPSWVGFFINIFSVIILTRYFLPDVYGLINTFNATGTFLMGLVCLGLDSGFMRYFFEPPAEYDRKQLFFISMTIPVMTLLFVSLVLLIAIPSQLSKLLFGIENFFILILLAVNVVAQLITRFLTIYYRMEGNTRLYSILTIGMQVSLKGGLVFAALIKPTYEFAMLCSVIVIVLMVIVFLLLFGNKIMPEKKWINFKNIKNLRSFFRYSIYTWPIPSLLYFNIIATLILIREKLGSVEVGIFASVSVFVGIIGVLQTGFSTFWSGYMFENYKTKNHFIKQVHDYVSFFTIILMCSFLLFRDLMFLLIGKNFQNSKPFFAILLLYPLFLILSETTCYGVSIAKKTGLLLIVTVLTMVSNLAIIWIFVPSWGILAPCFGSAISGLVFFVLQTYYGQQYYTSLLSWKRTIFAILILIVLALGNLVYIDSFLSIVILVLICAVLSLVVYRELVRQIFSLTRNFFYSR
jgi:O-antigen/teichoic acid export membrane protein